MKDYHINVFWSDEDGCYVADIPDLASCSALVKTQGMYGGRFFEIALMAVL